MATLILDIPQLKDKKLFIDLAKRLNVKHHEKPFTFSPDIIRFEGKIFVLHQKLNCQVETVDGNFLINSTDFDLSVWGNSKEDVEDAFAFSFYALYHNFYNESNEKLSQKAIKIKEKLHKTIKFVIE